MACMPSFSQMGISSSMRWSSAIATVSHRGSEDIEKLLELPKIIIVASGGLEKAAAEQGIDHKASDSTRMIRTACFICR